MYNNIFILIKFYFYLRNLDFYFSHENIFLGNLVKKIFKKILFSMIVIF